MQTEDCIEEIVEAKKGKSKQIKYSLGSGSDQDAITLTCPEDVSPLEIVWLNTTTMVVHLSGRRWYETTLAGHTVPLGTALQKGCRVAANGQ